MKIVTGKYNNAKIFTDNIEEEALNQIQIPSMNQH